MSRTSHRQRYAAFLAQLRETRQRAGITQMEMAERLANTQTFVSKCERGERRLDVVDLIDFLEAVGASPEKFVAELCDRLDASPKTRTRQQP